MWPDVPNSCLILQLKIPDNPVDWFGQSYQMDHLISAGVTARFRRVTYGPIANEVARP